MHRARDSGRLDFRVLGDRALIHLVDGAVPQLEPAQEVPGGQRMPVMDRLMSAHRAAPIKPGAEQDSLPEIAHDRKMRIQAVDPDFREWPCKRVIDEDLAVEAAQQRLHVAAIGQIPRRLSHEALHVTTVSLPYRGRIKMIDFLYISKLLDEER